MEQKIRMHLIDISDYDKVKTKMYIRLVGEERYEDLQNIPYKEIATGLYATYHVNISEEEENGHCSFAVTDLLREKYDVSLEQLHSDALFFSSVSRPAEIEPLYEVVMRFSKVDTCCNESNSNNTYLITTEDKYFGASAILYPNIKEIISEKVGGDYYILPSSIHELLAVPDDGSGNYRIYEDMVRSVNKEAVTDDDKLADTVYHYDHLTGNLQTAREFYAERIRCG